MEKDTEEELKITQKLQEKDIEINSKEIEKLSQEISELREETKEAKDEAVKAGNEAREAKKGITDLKEHIDNGWRDDLVQKLLDEVLQHDDKLIEKQETEEKEKSKRIKIIAGVFTGGFSFGLALIKLFMMWKG